jgi:hypothetical protein
MHEAGRARIAALTKEGLGARADFDKPLAGFPDRYLTKIGRPFDDIGMEAGRRAETRGGLARSNVRRGVSIPAVHDRSIGAACPDRSFPRLTIAMS